MDDYKKEELKEEIFQALWSEKTTPSELKSRCKSEEERILIDEVAGRVERTGHDFVAGFKQVVYGNK